MESPLRQEILRLSRERPGITLGEIRDGLNVSWGTVQHHVSKLSEERLVKTVVVGRRHMLYARRREVDPIELVARSHLRGRTAWRVAQAIAVRPHGSVADIIPLIGKSPRAVYYHVRRLMDKGLVESRSSSSHFDLVPHPALARLLAETIPRLPKAIAREVEPS